MDAGDAVGTVFVRASGMIEEVVGDDVLVYDPARHQAFRLSEEAAILWRARTYTISVDGAGGIDQRRWTALAELQAAGLVTAATAPKQGQISRARLMRLGLGVAAAASSGVFVERMLIPTPAAAASPFPDAGSSDSPPSSSPPSGSPPSSGPPSSGPPTSVPPTGGSGRGGHSGGSHSTGGPPSTGSGQGKQTGKQRSPHHGHG